MGDSNKNTGRFHTEDVVPQDAATDVDFQRAIQQLEDQQHGRAGWLFARGAFDKGDQAYLREQEERRRHAEEATLDRERAQFLAARVRAEEEERRQAMLGGRSVQIITGKPGSKTQPEKERKKRALPIIVKPSDPSLAGNVSLTGSLKKAKTVSSTGEGDKPAASEPLAPTEAEEAEEDEGTGVLAGLLGGYDSDSDDGASENEEENEREKDQNESGGGTNSAKGIDDAQLTKKSPLEKPLLPSAADLLG